MKQGHLAMSLADLGVIQDFLSKPQFWSHCFPSYSLICTFQPPLPTPPSKDNHTLWLNPKKVLEPEEFSKNSLQTSLVLWQNPLWTRQLKTNIASSTGVRKPYIVFWGLLERAEIFFFSGEVKPGLLHCSWDCFQPHIQDICYSDCISPSQVHTLGLLNIFTRKSA